MPAAPTQTAIPSTLLIKCWVSPPPTGNELLTAKDKYKDRGITDVWEARFLLMSDKWMQQTDNLGNCNKQLDSLGDWNTKQMGLETKHDTGAGSR